MRRAAAVLLLAALIGLGRSPAPAGASPAPPPPPGERSATTSTTWPPIGGSGGDVEGSTRVADAVRFAAVGAVGLAATAGVVHLVRRTRTRARAPVRR